MNDGFYIFLTVFCSMLVSVLAVPVVMEAASAAGLFDHVDSRKIHSGKIPRIGGIGIFLGFSLVWVWVTGFCIADITLFCGAAIIFAVGLYDDLRQMPPRWKLAGQTAAALVVVAGGTKLTTLGNLFGFGIIHLGWASVPFSVFAVVGIINAINMIDGMDGLAAGVVSIAATAMGYIAWLNGDLATTLFAAGLTGSLVGFLKYNSYPARIFMGDSGSLFIGYCIAVLSIRLVEGAVYVSRAVPLILLAVPVVDTLYVMFVRLKSGSGLFRADNNHIHHRLFGKGLTHPVTVMAVYFLAYALAVVAILCRQIPSYINVPLLLFYYGSVYFSMIYLVEHEKVLRNAYERTLAACEVFLAGVLPFMARLRFEPLIALVLFVHLWASGAQFQGSLPAECAAIGVCLVLAAAVVLASTRNLKSPFFGLLLFFILGLVAYIACTGRETGITGALENLGILSLLVLLGVRMVVDRKGADCWRSPLESFAIFVAFSVFVLPASWVQGFSLYHVAGKALIMVAACKAVAACGARWAYLFIGGYLLSVCAIFAFCLL